MFGYMFHYFTGSLELEFPENFEELREFHDKRAEEPNPSDAGKYIRRTEKGVRGRVST